MKELLHKQTSTPKQYDDSRVFLDEFQMEIFESLHVSLDVFEGWENGHAEVISAGSLAKARSGHHAQTNLLQDAEAVKRIRRLSGFLLSWENRCYCCCVLNHWRLTIHKP